MIKNYLRSAVMNLCKNKFFTLINLIGLSIGITGLFLVFIFISHEQSYDKYHQDSNLIFRVLQKEVASGDNSIGESTAPPLALEFLNTIPEIEAACRVLEMGERKVETERFTGYENGFRLVDPSFFQIFTIPVLSGNPAKEIDDRDNVVITRRMAEKYFDSIDVTGKTIKIRDKDYTVGGVVENPPSYSHLQYDILCTIYYIQNEEFHKNAWLWHAIETYVKIYPAATQQQVDEKIRRIHNTGAIESFKDAGLDYEFMLQPLTRIHQQEVTEHGIITSASARNVKIFRLLAVFVMFLACLNFVNLTLALYFRRIKEVSIRKLIGAHPLDLVRQFLLETIIVITLALALSIVIAELVLPSFLNYTDIPAQYLNKLPVSNFVIFGLVIVAVGLIAGVYPAFYASRQKLMKAMGHGKVKLSNSVIRPVLIIAQFAIAVVIIIVMISMQQQVKFMQNQDLGFNNQQKLILTMQREMDFDEKYETYKKMFTDIEGVKSASASSTLPGTEFSSYYIETNDDDLGGKVQKTMYCFSIDEDFVPIYDVGVIAGRNFDPEIDTDPTLVFLMSEKGIKYMGWQNYEDALGKEIITGNRGRQGKIIGIVNDFNFMSLQYEIYPLFLEYMPADYSFLTLNVQDSDLTGLIKRVRNTWEKEFPGIPFKHFFADEAFNKHYQNEIRAITLMKVFGLVAIIIACSGLVGISLFVTQQKIKEIGIRKVLGATVPELLLLLNNRFLLLVGFANLIAWPVAYYALLKWLQNFAYRMNINVWTFFAAGLFSAILFLFTLSMQTIKAANTNPVEILKYE